MALRSDASGDGVVFTGDMPATLRPFSLCGWVNIRQDMGRYHSLVVIDCTDGTSWIEVDFRDTGTNFALVYYGGLGGVNPWYYERPLTGISHNQYFFFALTLADGANQYPTLYWRAQSASALTSYNQGNTSNTGNPVPSQIALLHDPSTATTWANAAMTGFRWWSSVKTAQELLAESYSLLPKSWSSNIIAAPLVADVRDYSAFGKGRVGSATGLAVEAGPPVRWR